MNGDEVHPLFRYLKEKKPRDRGNEQTEGFLEKLKSLGEAREGSDIRWNFTKFLVDRRGQVVERYSPTIAPKDLRSDIEELLK